MDKREKQIRQTLKKISSLAGSPPPPEDGPDELIVCCWNIGALMDRLMVLTGGMDGTYITTGE